jgi:L-lactate dehydrogenase complex protein LldG
MSAREEILARVRSALADVAHDEQPPEIQRAYRRESGDSPAAVVTRFVQRVEDYAAQARRLAEEDLAQALARACEEWRLRRVVVPPELPASWRPSGVELIEDEGLTAHELDRIDGAITGCAAAIAETGTIALDGRGACGRRAITLVPDHHICIVRGEQIRATVPEGIAALADAVSGERAPVTLISGPSASSDIELSRVEGVHGPRHLLVLVLD